MKENIYLYESTFQKEKKKIKTYTRRNFIDIPQIQSSRPPTDYHAINVVSSVLPFKVNSYVIDELIVSADPVNDPIFRLTFPQKEMLSEDHFQQIESTTVNGKEGPGSMEAVAKIRMELNPHPAGQNKNIPKINGLPLKGIQHKYRETVLFFPSSGQTCHAYCTFCFRWPQFTAMEDMRFAMTESLSLVKYVARHPEVSDVLFTGGDPMVMS